MLHNLTTVMCSENRPKAGINLRGVAGLGYRVDNDWKGESNPTEPAE